MTLHLNRRTCRPSTYLSSLAPCAENQKGFMSSTIHGSSVHVMVMCFVLCTCHGIVFCAVHMSWYCVLCCAHVMVLCFVLCTCHGIVFCAVHMSWYCVLCCAHVMVLCFVLCTLLSSCLLFTLRSATVKDSADISVRVFSVASTVICVSGKLKSAGNVLTGGQRVR
jgi:hypothetical protein